MMQSKYYMAAAFTVGEYRQGDDLYLMKLSDGRIIGYSEEFEYATSDLPEASSANTSHLAKWFGVSVREKQSWKPLALDEIVILQLQKCVIGWKSAMRCDTPIELIQW